jgi:Predicted membrane protein (DUF2232)
MLHRFAVAIGAGCAAALLFVVSGQSSVIGMALAYLAPLPIMIATMGWGLDIGAIAGVISVAALALLAEPLSALLFAASVAGPAWALAAYAVTPVARYLGAQKANASVHASLGAIILAASFIGMLAGAAALTTMIVLYGGYAEAARQAAAALAVLAGEALDGASNKGSAREFAETIVRFAPPAIAGSTLLMLCVNLYGAARSTELSHRLQRDWPDLPTALNLPWPLGAIFLACLAAAYALPLPATAAQYFSVVAGGLGGAFVLQGLAVAHALSRGLKMRPLMLAALYACCVLRAKYTLPVVAALGLVDAVFKLRARAAFLPTPTRTVGK